MYHSTALLLPDARVLVAGGGRFHGDASIDHLTAQIYSPPYLFAGPRPSIFGAPATAAYQEVISIATPDVSQIGSAVLIPLGSVAHTINTNQRYVELPFTRGLGRLDAQIPASANILPPGYYMLFLVNAQGVPSTASILQVQFAPAGSLTLAAIQSSATSANWRAIGTEQWTWSAKEWLEFQADFGSGGVWTLGVTATNQTNNAAPGLPPGYAFNLVVTVDGIVRGTLSIPGSTTTYRTGALTVTFPTGIHTPLYLDE